MFGFAALSTDRPRAPRGIPAASECAGEVMSNEPLLVSHEVTRITDLGQARVTGSRIFRVRTASSAVRPASSWQRANLDIPRTSFSSGFDHQAVSLSVCPASFPFVPGGLSVFWARDGQKLRAMRPRADSGQAGVPFKELSCQKNWLSPRPPTNGGSRFWKKVS